MQASRSERTIIHLNFKLHDNGETRDILTIYRDASTGQLYVPALGEYIVLNATLYRVVDKYTSYYSEHTGVLVHVSHNVWLEFATADETQRRVLMAGLV